MYTVSLIYLERGLYLENKLLSLSLSVIFIVLLTYCKSNKLKINPIKLILLFCMLLYNYVYILVYKM